MLPQALSRFLDLRCSPILQTLNRAMRISDSALNELSLPPRPVQRQPQFHSPAIPRHAEVRNGGFGSMSTPVDKLLADPATRRAAIHLIKWVKDQRSLKRGNPT